MSLDDVLKFLDFLTLLFERAPIRAMASGLAVSMGVTQFVKIGIPAYLSTIERQTIARVTAIVLGFLSTWTLLPTREGAVSGLVVGLWAPYMWAAGMRLIGTRYPQLREYLSQDSKEP